MQNEDRVRKYYSANAQMGVIQGNLSIAEKHARLFYNLLIEYDALERAISVLSKAASDDGERHHHEAMLAYLEHQFEGIKSRIAAMKVETARYGVVWKK